MERTKPKPNKFTVLALDPSLRGFGYTVLQDKTILKAGCIKTEPSGKKSRIRKGDDRMRRVSEINHVLKSLNDKYHINYIVAELPHGSQSAVSATAIALASAIVQTMADFLEIGLEWYSEGDAKKCVLGKQSAAKEEMINKINSLYNVSWKDVKYIDEAVADSLAIHYVASKYSPVLKAMK